MGKNCVVYGSSRGAQRCALTEKITGYIQEPDFIARVRRQWRRNPSQFQHVVKRGFLRHLFLQTSHTQKSALHPVLKAQSRYNTHIELNEQHR